MNEPNRRIAKNTLLMYFRSIICTLLSIYSSRLILKALGVEDYGIYNAVGGFVSMFWMVSTILSSSVGRFLNYELGRGDMERAKEVFSISSNVMVLLALLVVLLTETAGVWFLTSRMTIPPERLYAAKWIFHLSVLTTFSGFIVIPFNAAIVAHERLGVYAFVNICEAVVKLLVAILLLLPNLSLDKLQLYAILMALITICIHCVSIIFSTRNFPECRVYFKSLRSNRLREMLAFSGWNFLSSISRTFSGQGVNLAMNIFVGPVLNAARGISNTVSNSVGMLVYNFQLSIVPQLTQSYASNDHKRVKFLLLRGTRMLYYLSLVISMPLILETDFVLALWLDEYPDYSSSFVRLSLLSGLIFNLDAFLVTVLMAKGKIRVYQILVSIIVFCNFPFSYLLLKYGFSPVWVYVIAVFISLVKAINSVIFVVRYFPYSYGVFFRLYSIIAAVTIIGAILPLGLHIFMPYGWIRFLVVSATSVITVALSILYLGCSKEERLAIRAALYSRIKFLRPKG